MKIEELNPCIICGKHIKKGKEKIVSCQHPAIKDLCGHIDCVCGQMVGAGCFKKLKLKEIK